MNLNRMMGAVPLLMNAVPAQAATGDGGGVPAAGPLALLGVIAAVAWHFIAARWQRTHATGGRHTYIRVMPAHALVPVLSKFHLDREHLRLFGRRARRLYRRH